MAGFTFVALIVLIYRIELIQIISHLVFGPPEMEPEFDYDNFNEDADFVDVE